MTGTAGPPARDAATFFEYGSVELREVDARGRCARAEVRMPFVLMQTVTPALLGGGVIDGLTLREPLAVWVPRLTERRLSPAGAQVQAAHELINGALQERADDALRLYHSLSCFLSDPSDIIPFLPMGTYVTFHYRFRVDDVVRVLEAVDPHVGVAGVAEFQTALASVLREALEVTAGYDLRRLGT